MTTQLPDVVIHQGAAVQFTGEQVQLIKRTICKPKDREATDDELALFIGQAKRTGLDPFARQIYAVFRKNRQSGQEQMTIQAAIDGLRLVAERSGAYLGQQGPFWCDNDGQWTDVWPKTKNFPVASKVIVRKLIGGQIAETPAVAHWDEYAVFYGQNLADMWKNKPALMLAKCAEALALRKAFPNDMSGLYTSEEMGQADVSAPLAPVQTPAPASDVPADTTGFGAQRETIDPVFANDLLDECKKKLTKVSQFRDLLQAVGSGEVADLRSKDAWLAALSGLTVEQAVALEKALRDVQPASEAA